MKALKRSHKNTIINNKKTAEIDNHVFTKRKYNCKIYEELLEILKSLKLSAYICSSSLVLVQTSLILVQNQCSDKKTNLLSQ